MATKIPFLRGLAGFALGLFIAGISTSPAEATYTYDRTKAVAYAKFWACNAQTCENPAFMRLFGEDCTNFVSQSMNLGGGIPTIRVGSSASDWYYDQLFGIYIGPASWVRVSALYDQLRATGRISRISYPNMSSQNSGAMSADLYMYDWGKNEGFSHFSFSTEYGNFTDFFDTKAKRNYRTVTNGVGSKIAQHNTDRDGAPWNWGYHTELDPTVKARMRTVVIHLANSANF